MGYTYTDRDKAIQDALQLREDSGFGVLLVKGLDGLWQVWEHDLFFKTIATMGLSQEDIDRHYDSIDSFYPVSFWQPIFTDEEWEEQPIESCEVWATKGLAQNQFPGREIAEYTYNDIEDPLLHRS